MSWTPIASQVTERGEGTLGVYVQLQSLDRQTGDITRVSGFVSVAHDSGNTADTLIFQYGHGLSRDAIGTQGQNQARREALGYL